MDDKVGYMASCRSQRALLAKLRVWDCTVSSEGLLKSFKVEQRHNSICVFRKITVSSVERV